MSEETKKESFLDILKSANKAKNDKNMPKQKNKENKVGKPNRGFGGATVVRRSGRGG